MKRILIVEDDQILARIYRNKFQREQFLVESAADGQSALDMLAANPPDIVLLDLMLPKINGVEILKIMRSRSATQAVPVVVFTNAYLDTMIQDAWNAGATQCLTKAHCTPKQVVEIVRGLVQNPPAANPLQSARPNPGSFPPPATASPSIFPPPVGSPQNPGVMTSLANTFPASSAAAPGGLFPASNPFPAGNPFPKPSSPVRFPPATPTMPPHAPPAAAAPTWPVSGSLEPVFPQSPNSPSQPIANLASGADWLTQFTKEPSSSSTGSDFLNMNPDAQFQSDLRQTLAEQSAQTLNALRSLYQAVINAPDAKRRQPALFDFHRKIRSLANDATIANAVSLLRIAGAMEVLVKWLHDKPAQYNASAKNTLDQTLTLLEHLMPHLAKPEPGSLLQGMVLIADSDALTQRVLVLAVTRSDLKPIAMDDAALALSKLAEGPLDLVLVDSDLGNMRGMDFLRQMRQLPVHRETPAILVVQLQDVPILLSSLPTKFDDVIAKPIQFAELALKCQVHILRQNMMLSGWN